MVIPLELECGDPANLQVLKLVLPVELARDFLEHLSARVQDVDNLHDAHH